MAEEEPSSRVRSRLPAENLEQRLVEILGEDPLEISKELGFATSSSSSSAPALPSSQPAANDGQLFLASRGQRGLVLAWLRNLDLYLVQMLDGDVLRVPEARLRACEQPEGFDLTFSRFSQRVDVFSDELAEVLGRKHFATVRLCSTPAQRIEAAEAVKRIESWGVELPEFEADTMGRKFESHKASWEALEEEGLEAPSQELAYLGEALLSAAPRLGFVASGRTGVMLHAECTEEERKQIALPGSGMKVQSQVLQDRMAFRRQRKVCIMQFLGPSGGSLTLHSLQPGAKDECLSCKENQAIIFRHDLYDYTFEPAEEQCALQMWLIRVPLPGEASLMSSAVDAAEDLKKIPAGPLYGEGNETTDVLAVCVRDPGDVEGPERYWAMLSSGTDAVIPIPTKRWDNTIYYSPDPGDAGKGYIRHFGVLCDDQMENFDNEFFSMAPEEACLVDPPQRNCLEVGYDCLFRAGWTRQTLKGVSMAACYGYSYSEFSSLALRGGLPGGFQKDAFIQNTPMACANRLHFVLNMTGPVSTVETACSSSLSAVALTHTSMRPTQPDQLKTRASMQTQVKYGIAFGTNGHFDPFYTIALCGAGMLSHNGRCFTFDQSADGFIRGEGTGSMAFRVSSREDVSRLACLAGTCMNQDGRSASLTAPHGPSQQECIRHSLREAGIKPLDIQIQELHGTGTALGDPIEVGALRATMMKHEGVVREHPLVQTSSKSNFGHTEMCAGINGLVKCVLMGSYAAAAPNVHLRLLNPHIDDAAFPVYFGSEFVDQGKEYGYFGVSSFGFGGSNARADIWSRCQAGPRNTNPSMERVSFLPDRIQKAIETYGTLTMPLPGTDVFEEEHGDSKEGLSGEYTLGYNLKGKMQYFVKSSANGWAYGKMNWDDKEKAFCYAIMLGEALVEQFQISCDGFDDMKIFPETRLAGPEAMVLGPGTAPSGHTWFIDGRADRARPGTLYKIMMRWDADERRKKVSWEPVETTNLQLQVVRHGYYVNASWTAYRPFEMQVVRKGELYQAEVRIGIQGIEEFQLQRDADSLQVIYPAENGGKSSAVPVLGPDCRGQNKFWRVSGQTGELFTIQLEVTLSGVAVSAKSVRGVMNWTSMSPRRYFVTGTWNDGAFTKMQAVRGFNNLIHKLTFSMARAREEFQIVADQDLDLAIHPEMPMSDQLVSQIMGPGGKGRGLNWLIHEAPGADVELTLDLGELAAGADRRRAVTWKVIKPTKALSP
eukprot:TRINITY_DN58291_c0_g1_i1.p1 TRINITY_DN58291_c0_g1~~TRINITY_DN58291_c0_g1_i1.p1  ORF type:complete len:1227 (-),score=221.30 TRINITY_DN58291_c0_g1_i1:327-4007(-)